MRTMLIALFAAAVLIVPSSAAHAAKPPDVVEMRKFYVDFKASQNTTWNQPEYSRKVNCYRTVFHMANGSETWKLATRSSVKALYINTHGIPRLHVGSWDIDDLGDQVLEVGSTRTRALTQRAWVRGGECGGESEEGQLPPTDCGTRIPPLDVGIFLASNGKLKFTVGTESTDPNINFDHCPVVYPQGITERYHTEWVKTSFRSWLKSRRPQVTFDKTFKYKVPPGGRPTTSTTRVKWSLTLRPAR